MLMTTKLFKTSISAAAFFAVLGSPILFADFAPTTSFVGAAFADGHSSGDSGNSNSGGNGGNSNPGGGSGNAGSDGGGNTNPGGGGNPSSGGGDDHGDDGGDDHGDDDGHSGGSGGSDGHDSEGGDDHDTGEDHGSEGGQGSGSGNDGGRPVWAGEGIPEVELGRLNVIRSPESVLNRSYAEAMATLAANPEMANFYGKSLDQMIIDLRDNFEDQAYIDSPLQNLALLKDLLEDPANFSMPGVDTSERSKLLAVFLGTASDKVIPISKDTVKAVLIIFDVPMDEAAAEQLATDANAVRAAISEGHGI